MERVKHSVPVVVVGVVRRMERIDDVRCRLVWRIVRMVAGRRCIVRIDGRLAVSGGCRVRYGQQTGAGRLQQRRTLAAPEIGSARSRVGCDTRAARSPGHFVWRRSVSASGARREWGTRRDCTSWVAAANFHEISGNLNKIVRNLPREGRHVAGRPFAVAARRNIKLVQVLVAEEFVATFGRSSRSSAAASVAVSRTTTAAVIRKCGKFINF